MQKEPVIAESGATMKAIVVESYAAGPIMKTVPIPSPHGKEVLVKVECAPVTTFERLQTFTEIFAVPYNMGAQASGTVISLGSEVPADYLGKKVVVYTYGLIRTQPVRWEGVWSQYVVKKYTEVYVYTQSIPHEVACTMCGAPLTVLGLFRAIKSYNPKAVVLFPGASTISKALTKLLKKSGCVVFSIVRSETAKKTLKEMGHEAILDCSKAEFPTKFQGVVEANKPSLVVDAVGDQVSEVMFRLMPPKTTHLLYGMLGGKVALNLPLFNLVSEGKAVKGFFLRYHNEADPAPEISADLKTVDEDLKKGGEVFGVPVVKEYRLEEFRKAIEEQPTYASTGRGIIRFHDLSAEPTIL